MLKKKRAYHHGNLAESLLDAVDEIAGQFGLEAVTLRGCAKLVGVAPSSAFRHYTDKRALLTAFATRALNQLAESLESATRTALASGGNPFKAVGLAYVRFALEKPAFFRAMWREETIYTADEHYVDAADRLSRHLKSGFADSIKDADPNSLSSEELLAWSSVHGLANLFIDGPIANDESVQQKLAMAEQMLDSMLPAFDHS